MLRRLVLVIALLVAAGCSDSTPPDEAGAADFHVEIEHEYGVTEVTEKPTRVVSIGYREHDILPALGVVPIALQQWHSDYDAGVAPYAIPLLHDEHPVVFSFSATELDIGKSPS